MAEVTYTDALAIWKLIYYSIALFATIWVSGKHGFGRNSGWIFLAIFSIIRIVNSSAQIATITSLSDTPAKVAIITSFFGLSPLLLAALGILSRVYYSVLKAPWNFIFSYLVLKAVQTPAAIALVLCIVGGTSADDVLSIASEPTVRAGVILYVVVLVLLGLLTLAAKITMDKMQRGERQLLLALGLSLPFFALRMVYTLIVCFSGLAVFHGGGTAATTLELLLATLEEMVVVLIFVWAGLTNRAVIKPDRDDRPQGEVRKLGHRFGRGDFAPNRAGIATLAVAVLGALFRRRREEDKAARPVYG